MQEIAEIGQGSYRESHVLDQFHVVTQIDLLDCKAVKLIVDALNEVLVAPSSTSFKLRLEDVIALR